MMSLRLFTTGTPVVPQWFCGLSGVMAGMLLGLLGAAAPGLASEEDASSKFQQIRFVTAASPPPATPPQQRATDVPSQFPPIASTDLFLALASVDYLTNEERIIIAETNRLRTNPAAYAEELEALLPYFEGQILRLPGLPPLETYEGAAVVEEAIAVLRDTPPLPPLQVRRGMSKAAADHVADLGALGAGGHYGSDGSTPFERLNRYGTWQNGPGSMAGENISYSPFDIARWHVLQLVIDDGVPNRGHRTALLRPEYQYTGVACGEHIVFGTMCAITYASQYVDAEASE